MYASSKSIGLLAARGPSSVDQVSQAPRSIDEAAFHSIYQRTAATLWAYIRRSSGDASLADDILQETFYRFLRADLPPMEIFQTKAYLYRTANALLVDHWRRLQRERRWSLKNFLGFEAATERESGGEALGMFQRLKPQEQSLLWLAYVEDFNHKEVAEALRLSEKSVRVLLFRARKKLAAILKKQGLGPTSQ